MPAQAWPAIGTTISVDETGTSTYTLISQVENIKGFGGGSVAQVDSTWLSSTVKTFRSTIKEPGDVTFDLFFDPTDAVHKFIRNAIDTPATGPFNFKVVFPTTGTTSTVVQSANISGIDPDVGGIEENLTMSVTLKQTGLPTYVAPT